MAKKIIKDESSTGKETPKSETTPKEKIKAEEPVKEVDERREAIKKRFKKVADYKKKIDFQQTKFKPQEWIPMSNAYQTLAGIPGIPVGHLTTVYGKSDVGKTTFLIEAGKFALEHGVLPVMIITETKWSWERAENAGLYEESCLPYIAVKSVERGCEIMYETLNNQRDGKLPYDIIFLWDSIGATPTKAGITAYESGEKSKAMAATARVLREEFQRYIIPRINATREEGYPYNSTMVLVNQGYMDITSHVPSIVMYGGDGIYLPSSLIFRMGGQKGRASKVRATKGGVDISFALKSDFVLEKNHINGIEPRGKIICVEDGFILEGDLEAYKKKNRSSWMLEYDSYWDKEEYLSGVK